jgi:hypothetical protein
MATFGNTTIGSAIATDSDDRLHASQYTASGAGSWTQGYAYLSVSTGTSVGRIVVYADNGSNLPGAFVATSAEFTISSSTPSWINAVFGSPVATSNGVKYWIGVHLNDPGAANYTTYGGAVAGGTRRLADNYEDGSVNPWSGGANAVGPINVYLDDTPLGGATGHGRLLAGQRNRLVLA